MISLEFLVNFLNKFKCLNRIKPHINLLGLKISLNRSFLWYIFYFSQFSQKLSEMNLKVDLLKL